MSATQRGRDWLMEKGAADGGGSDQNDDQPLTGQPVQGRSGVNKPSASTGGGGGGLTESLPIPSGGGGTPPARRRRHRRCSCRSRRFGGRRCSRSGRVSSVAPPVIDATSSQHVWVPGDYGAQSPADGRTNRSGNGQQRTLPPPAATQGGKYPANRAIDLGAEPRPG